MEKCNHEKVKELNIVVISGLLNRKMIVCVKCNTVLESIDYEVTMQQSEETV
jgi:hypothetical protein